LNRQAVTPARHRAKARVASCKKGRQASKQVESNEEQTAKQVEAWQLHKVAELGKQHESQADRKAAWKGNNSAWQAGK
jgi:hypothetical protein